MLQPCITLLPNHVLPVFNVHVSNPCIVHCALLRHISRGRPHISASLAVAGQRRQLLVCVHVCLILGGGGLPGEHFWWLCGGWLLGGLTTLPLMLRWRLLRLQLHTTFVGGNHVIGHSNGPVLLDMCGADVSSIVIVYHDYVCVWPARSRTGNACCTLHNFGLHVF